MASKKKVKDKAYLELNGSINLVSIKNGTKTIIPIDGNTILKAILLMIEQGIYNFGEQLKVKSKKTKTKK